MAQANLDPRLAWLLGICSVKNVELIRMAQKHNKMKIKMSCIIQIEFSEKNKNLVGSLNMYQGHYLSTKDLTPSTFRIYGALINYFNQIIY